MIDEDFQAVVIAKLDRIIKIGESLMSTGGQTAQDVLDLQAAVASETTVEGSAITLLQSLSAQLTAALASSNPVAAVEAVVTTMNANQTALAAAVVANTPAAPAAGATAEAKAAVKK
jgi:hypothetical protein